VRRAAREVGSSLGEVQMDTLRLRLLKVAAHVTQSVRRILVRLPRAFPFADVFASIAQALMSPAPT
jgi:DDE family transposase